VGVDHPQRGQVDQGRPEDVAVGDDHRQVGLQRGEFRDERLPAGLLGLEEPQAERAGKFRDRRRMRGPVPSDRLVRLGHDANHLVLAGEPPEAGDGVSRSSQE
jgi:hypothetical protein